MVNSVFLFIFLELSAPHKKYKAYTIITNRKEADRNKKALYILLYSAKNKYPKIFCKFRIVIIHNRENKIQRENKVFKELNS